VWSFDMNEQFGCASRRARQEILGSGESAGLACAVISNLEGAFQQGSRCFDISCFQPWPHTRIRRPAARHGTAPRYLGATPQTQSLGPQFGKRPWPPP